MFIDGQFTHTISEAADVGTARVEVQNDRFFQNPLNRFDADRNGSIEPLDALQVLNAIVRIGSGPVSIPMGDDDISNLYFDVSGDNTLEPLDALLVLNAIAQINRGSEPEGETLLPLIDYSSSHLKQPTQREMVDIAVTAFDSIGHVVTFGSAQETHPNIVAINDWMQELGVKHEMQEAEDQIPFVKLFKIS